MELVKQQEVQLQINSHLAFAIRLAEPSPCRGGLFKRYKLIIAFCISLSMEQEAGRDADRMLLIR